MDKRDKPLDQRMQELGEAAKAELKRRGIDYDRLSPAERDALLAESKKSDDR